jgi:hypothetical protein
MIWERTNRGDPTTRDLADRHYNRQHVGSPQFVPPGRCLVLRAPGALWVTSWPFAEYVKHAWAGAWMCSAFRNERPDLYLSSDLIREAVAATRWEWPDPPDLGMVTFVNPSLTRHKRDPGRCFRRAGFHVVGHTGKGLIALQLLPSEMPDPVPALSTQMTFEELTDAP